MNKKPIALILVVLLLSELGVAWGTSSRWGVEPSGQSLAISELGTLMEVFDANGKSRFGKLTGDGFSVTYEIQGKTITASALGTKESGLQAGQVKRDGQSASVTVTTSDKALEITSYFILDEGARKMIVGRMFRNVSDKPISLKTVQDKVDPRIVVGGSQSSQSADLMRSILHGLKAGFLGPLLECGGGGPPRCPFPPACDCVPPEPCYPPRASCQGLNNLVGLNLIGAPQASPATKRMNDEVVLEMQGSVLLAPRSQARNADSSPRRLKENEGFTLLHVILR